MELVPNNSLKCTTPEDGRRLAISLALQTSFAMQPDEHVQEIIRTTYANNPEDLLAASQVVATEFATIAAANDYWR
ncbi:hexameric tyrosine-coordinated heme protein [Arthrobacter zhangbolii]|uniref:Hexameric tyrosine-coordinated heme protein n=1 Tax=Arthrobacter zhangbolii TaxID=2886936 RepID=A0A9X1M7T0_9MICC|nr:MULTISPECIES: hexameric tyrosine-coordinated heme protein [Arthrobacter]MCC3272107.1 hexameric tyrosine-coordinated heme protein [Arthrobacter zhangbolii]MCC3294418.1 hexameric tyrosine-coordinated heme protein [Arthrobacter zhangbolii]MDN3903159.1 hexameric tyrosine-coordinated heme protein [Arthrobacter sp. YD2]UON92019.1 hexameric tyrosine-coordinated heme protein [Arthrobacter zhangbolii]